MIRCVKATKVGDSILKTEDGNLQPIYPDTHYDRGTNGYWMLKRIGNFWIILQFLIGRK